MASPPASSPASPPPARRTWAITSAIRPAVAASRRGDVQSFYFLADYHALIATTCAHRPFARLGDRRDLAGLRARPGEGALLPSVGRAGDSGADLAADLRHGQGLMNRAHAYKAAVDANTAAGEDPDAGVSMGLYSYPIPSLAADILMFNAHQVPVGATRSSTSRWRAISPRASTNLFGAGRRFFVLPEAVIEWKAWPAARPRRAQDEQEL